MFLDEHNIKGVNMKKILSASLIAAMALTTVNASSLSQRISDLESEISDLKKKVKKQNKKLNKVKAHDANDNIKWSADVRTAVDNINYDMANGDEYSKDTLYSLRLWLNMEYAPDTNNVFKAQLSMNKAFGAKFSMPGQFDGFDWTLNEALTDNTLKVRQAYWLYLGDSLFGADIPWTFSVGRRPSTGGFLANLREDDAPLSPLGHIINVEFDGLSSKIDLSNVTGVPGMSFKLCTGYGSTNAQPLIGGTTPSAEGDGSNLEDIKLAGFIFEPYNDGQFVVKTTWFKAWDLPGVMTDGGMPPMPITDLVFGAYAFEQFGDMTGGAISILVDGLADEGFLADTKVFGSFAYSETHPYVGKAMLGSTDNEIGTSWWVGTQLPVFGGKLGLEYNHGSKYWRPFTYAEDTMIGSKLAARGDAFEIYYTYPLTEALSAQVRYTHIDYDYSGSNGFFGNFTGTPLSMDEANMYGYGGQVVDKATDLRAYIRYRF